MGNLKVLPEIPQLVNSETVHDMTAPTSSIMTTMAKFDTLPPKKSETANIKDLKKLLRFYVSKDEEVGPFLDSCKCTLQSWDTSEGLKSLVE